MNKVILFTPVGGTDPISSTNCRDGSMLHICRMYKPDKLIMYMSKEMLDYQDQDDRYRYCLDRLAEQQNRVMEYEVIERWELTKVHEFDYFYEDFRAIIEKIYREMDSTDTLLLNISSGTPAMKSGLAVLQTLGEFPAKLIQVSTPERKINEHIHKDYDVELLWELDEDNEEPCENRCKEIQCPTLSKIKKEEIIKKHITVYDYQAALEVADTMSAENTEKYRELLYLASRRVLLDFAGVDQAVKKTGFQCLPIKTSSDRKYFEYALNVDIKLKRSEYADFIRAITPLVVDMLELILKKQCGVVIDDYCSFRKRHGETVREWSPEKLKNTVVGNNLNKYYRSKGKNFQMGNVYSDALRGLLSMMNTDQHLNELVDDIRKVESRIRNLAAHQIISITDEKIQKETGFTGGQIMDKLKELFVYTAIPVKKEYWKSYEILNEKILEQMG